MDIVDRTLARPDLPILDALCRMEDLRRTSALGENEPTLIEFEKTYDGPEVGIIRRAANALMLTVMPTGGALLDYGCGGWWWKDDYWPRFERVDAVEVNHASLESIAPIYPAVNLYYTSNGLFDAPIKYDCVLSSGVVGSVLTAQAKLHLQICYDSLKPGGVFVFTRVSALNLSAIIKGNRLVMAADYSFSVYYTRKELTEMLTAIGFRNIQYRPLGICLPKVSWRLMQIFSGWFPRLMRDVLPSMFPFICYQHFFTATK